MTTRRTRRSWGKIQRMRSARWQASYAGPDLRRHTAPVTFTAKAAQRAECAAILSNTTELRAHLPARQLPPGTVVSYATMRGLAILRQRERDEQ
jgi:hypothetical protein